MTTFKATLRPVIINKARAKVARAKAYQGYLTWKGSNKEQYLAAYNSGFNAAWAFCLNKPYHKPPKGYEGIAWHQGFQEGVYNYDQNN